MTLSVWSDCSGINSEMYALNEISAAMRSQIGIGVTFSLYFTCDSDRKCIECASHNHQPAHTSHEMKQRNFTTGQFGCDTHKQNHDMPTSGLDLYAGTYPCSPWSRRGSRTGFRHPDASVAMVGVQSIAYMRPAVWIIEVGEMPSPTRMAELMEKINEVLNTNGAAYTMQPLRNLTPALCGIPARRPRTFIIGWRNDVAPAGQSAAPLADLVGNPMSVDVTFASFLGLRAVTDWSRVWAIPAPCRDGVANAQRVPM